MSGEVVAASWATRVYKVRAFFYNDDAIVMDRGVYEFDTKTVEDNEGWEWLYKQIDADRIVTGRVCAADLIYDYLPGNVVVGRDRQDGCIRLILCNAA